MTTLTEREVKSRMALARDIPNLAHLPSFGLMAPHNWDYNNPELMRRAEAILQAEGTPGTVTETAPANFWFVNPLGELHLHFWE